MKVDIEEGENLGHPQFVGAAQRLNDGRFVWVGVITFGKDNRIEVKSDTVFMSEQAAYEDMEAKAYPMVQELAKDLGLTGVSILQERHGKPSGNETKH